MDFGDSQTGSVFVYRRKDREATTQLRRTESAECTSQSLVALSPEDENGSLPETSCFVFDTT